MSEKTNIAPVNMRAEHLALSGQPLPAEKNIIDIDLSTNTLMSLVKISGVLIPETKGLHNV